MSSACTRSGALSTWTGCITVSRELRVPGWGAAERAYRQLSVELRNRGSRAPADRFSYRADIMRRKALAATGPRAWLGWAGSAFLWAVAALRLPAHPVRNRLRHSYRSVRSFVRRGVGRLATPAGAQAAVTLSLLAFHGRGVGSDPFGLGSTIAALTAAEAVVGLLLEITFIATLTRRLLGRLAQFRGTKRRPSTSPTLRYREQFNQVTIGGRPRLGWSTRRATTRQATARSPSSHQR